MALVTQHQLTRGNIHDKFIKQEFGPIKMHEISLAEDPLVAKE
jgi:hypothetical protein